MKNTGLQNRFPDMVREVWIGWYSCGVCGMNQWDVLHHIISPSCNEYKSGKHNQSVLNSIPLHNYRHPSSIELKKQGNKGYGITKDCHIGNGAYLHSHIEQFLSFTIGAITLQEYELLPIDLDFLDVYADLYKTGFPSKIINTLGNGRVPTKSNKIMDEENKVDANVEGEEEEKPSTEGGSEVGEQTSNEPKSEEEEQQ